MPEIGLKIRDCSALCRRGIQCADQCCPAQQRPESKTIRAPTLLMHPYYYILMELSYFNLWISAAVSRNGPYGGCGCHGLDVYVKASGCGCGRRTLGVAVTD